jgi:hypothetical protein
VPISGLDTFQLFETIIEEHNLRQLFRHTLGVTSEIIFLLPTSIDWLFASVRNAAR